MSAADLRTAPIYHPKSVADPPGDDSPVVRDEWSAPLGEEADTPRAGLGRRPRSPDRGVSTSHTAVPVWMVEQYARWLLAEGRAVSQVLAELDERIDAHGEVNGCCGCGCNASGWLEPFPCLTRRSYVSVRAHLSSTVNRHPIGAAGAASVNNAERGPCVMPDREARRGLDVTVAHSARVYDWWLGGKDNFAADRELGQQVVDLVPMTPASARANRAFLHRAAGIVAEYGVHQFLDRATFV